MGTGVFQHFVTTDSLMAFPGLKAPFKVPLLLLLGKKYKTGDCAVNLLFCLYSCQKITKKIFPRKEAFVFFGYSQGEVITVPLCLEESLKKDREEA